MCCVHRESTGSLRVPCEKIFKDNLERKWIFCPPGKQRVGHEPGQVLLLLVEHHLVVVTRVAFVQGKRHCFVLLLALQGVEVDVEDSGPRSVLAAALVISLGTSGWCRWHQQGWDGICGEENGQSCLSLHCSLQSVHNKKNTREAICVFWLVGFELFSPWNVKPQSGSGYRASFVDTVYTVDTVDTVCLLCRHRLCIVYCAFSADTHNQWRH